MSLLTARKPLKFQGQKFDTGDVLKPQPKGRMRRILLDGRFVYDDGAEAEAQTAPAPEPAPAPTPQPEQVADPEVEKMTKAQLIKELKAAGVPGNKKINHPELVRRVTEYRANKE